MNITPMQASNQYRANDKEVKAGKPEATSIENSTKGENVKQGKYDEVIITNNQADKKVTYDKPNYNNTVKSDTATIDVLREESNRAYSQLRELVERLLADQGHTFNQLLNGEISTDKIEIDSATQSEAASLIADDGPLGAEAVSNRIVDFAIAISGGDKTQLDKLKGAIEKGFGEAKSALGGQLPDVSMKTHDLVMEKLQRWSEEE